MTEIKELIKTLENTNEPITDWTYNKRILWIYSKIAESLEKIAENTEYIE